MPTDQHSLYGMEYVERVPRPTRRDPGDVLPGEYLLDENGDFLLDENDEKLIA